MIIPWALLSLVFMVSNNREKKEMKLLHRIQALDASRRLDVVNKYIPALLVHEDHAWSESDNSAVVGHIHSSLVETLREKIDEMGDSLPNKESFLLPPPNVGQTSPTPSSSLIGESSSLVRNSFFGLLVDKTPKSDSPAALTEARSATFERFTDLLLECKIISKRHTDMYPITDLRKPEGGILATINRNAAPYLGIRSVGVHLLCYVRDDPDDGIGGNKAGSNVSLWLAQRAANKSHNALRWDPTVAGGQPASLGFFENVVKEAGEEAGIDADLVTERAVATGCLSQMTCKPDGTCMKPSLYYTWDMQVDRETFVPQPADGEVSVFELCSAKQLVYEVRHGERLRPAMILVVTDFLIRHGIITPDNEPDYAQIISAMHREPLRLEHHT